MKKTLIASVLVLTTTAAYAASITLDAGKSLRQQTKTIAANAGYTVLWKLDVDAPAGESVHPYARWQDAIYGATKQLSKTTTADTKIADLAAPVVCDGSKTIVVTTLGDARNIVRAEPGCQALK
ncbi:hypothetical protein A8H39_01660 [Paraburkholderia fungorum]|nr:hypothetical protein A8H39_01660 [Paraburkholderia fungorum]